MNVIKYQLNPNDKVVYCLVDNTYASESAWAGELVKNLSDFTVSNLVEKRLSLFQGVCQEDLLFEAVQDNFEYAVVFTTGTEFIGDNLFFKELELLLEKDFFLAGHILDRNDAYYELHEQCYVINLKTYKELNYPKIGKQELGSSHKQNIPNRSSENIHDDYTPLWVLPGADKRSYKHKAHGWNILSIAFENNLPVIVFDSAIRSSKKHYYPSHRDAFLKEMQWAYYRYEHCLQDFVHTENSEYAKVKDCQYEQVLTPASGTKIFNVISNSAPVTVIFYDYNQKTLDYRKENVPQLPNVSYKFVKLDLLGLDFSLDNILDTSIENTLINMSNIFCYEGTAMFAPLSYRVFKENLFIEKLKKEMPLSYLYFSTRAASGFVNHMLQGRAVDFELTALESLKKPSWRLNGDWT